MLKCKVCGSKNFDILDMKNVKGKEYLCFSCFGWASIIFYAYTSLSLKIAIPIIRGFKCKTESLQ